MPLPPTHPPTTHGLLDRLRQAHRSAITVPGVPRHKRAVIAARTTLLPSRRIAVGPAFPNAYSVLRKLAALNGYQLVGPHHPDPDLAVHYTPNDAEAVECEFPPSLPVVNRRCADRSKSHVAAVFERVFGYPLSVDPTTYEGQIVEKSDSNATHDGRLLDGPLDPSEVREGFVYQRAVGNVHDAPEGPVAVDYRTPLYGGRPPLVIVKRRPAPSRFRTSDSPAEVCEASEVYSPDELGRLAEFADAIGLDFGDLDVLRDRDTGRIYVVDVANTPSGPSVRLPVPERRRTTERLAAAFDAVVSDLMARSPAP